MFLILAVIFELCFDWVPEGAPLEEYPFFSLFQNVLGSQGYEFSRWEKKEENTWVFWNLGPRVHGIDLSQRPPEKMVLFMWEPETTQKELYQPEIQRCFGKIFTWDDDLVDGKKFFKFYYPVLEPRIEKIPSFEEKKFCTMIARRLSSKHPKQLYREREKVIRFFEDKPNKFDLYGPYWERRKYKNWKGIIQDKLAVLKNYKYSICYENTKEVKGYITEKIFHCFAAGVVPVYWGASNVTDYIPEECFIDRRKFKDEKALYRFLKKITKEEYERYLESAARFLKSEKAQLFSGAQFGQTLRQLTH